jgi:hypothetical protein
MFKKRDIIKIIVKISNILIKEFAPKSLDLRKNFEEMHKMIKEVKLDQSELDEMKKDLINKISLLKVEDLEKIHGYYMDFFALVGVETDNKGRDKLVLKGES